MRRRMRPRAVVSRPVNARIPALLATFMAAPAALAATPEDIGFVSEHLPEIAMDNRYAQLPLWVNCTEQGYCPSFNVGYASTHSQTLSIDGPMFSLGLTHDVGPWEITGFAFYDPLTLASGTERRPLDVDFVSGVPYQLPAPAEFSGLHGSADDMGLGVALRRDASLPGPPTSSEGRRPVHSAGSQPPLRSAGRGRRRHPTASKASTNLKH